MGEDPKRHPGHEAVLRHLREREQEEPLVRAQVAGSVVFDLFVGVLRDQAGRVRIDDLIAALAPLGGHLCLVAVLDTLKERGLTPAQVGMLEAEGRDGHRYYFARACRRARRFALASWTEFDKTELPDEHQPALSPFDWVQNGRLTLSKRWTCKRSGSTFARVGVPAGTRH